jgi:hypothetical protein
MPIVVLSACVPLIGIHDLEADAEDAGRRPAKSEAGAGDVLTVMDAGEDAPADTAPPFKRVFVTSDVSNGVMGGIAGADARCAAAAGRGKLGSTWVAWISSSTVDARDRIEFQGTFRLLDGKEVVANRSQLLSGKLSVPIDVDETGTTATGFAGVWTGAAADGRASDTCNDWTSNGVVVFGAQGSFDQTGVAWTKNGGPGGGFENWGCQTSSRLYCFER